jgi:hypothetical protein
MQRTSTTLITPLTDIREGNRYYLVVTGTTTAVTLEFEHVAGSGTWFLHPAVPVAYGAPPTNVVAVDFIAPCTRMRVRCASGQVNPWTVTYVKHVVDQV